MERLVRAFPLLPGKRQAFHAFTDEMRARQLNIARLAAPVDSPQLAEFVANLERINTLAEASPGFVWRLQTEDGDAAAIKQEIGALPFHRR